MYTVNRSSSPNAGAKRAYLGLLIALACSDGPSEGEPSGPDGASPRVASVTVALEASEMAVGQTTSAAATLRDARGREVRDRAIAWTSSQPAVASVSASGASANVTAMGFGTATISATSEGLTGRAAVLVVETPFFSVQLTSGFQYACGRARTGAGYCWHADLEPTSISEELRFVELAAGDRHTCGILSTGRPVCWGDNERGQLGDGTTVARGDPTQISGTVTFVELSAGQSQTCGRTSAGTAYCWGDNRWGQVGDGTTLDRRMPTPVSGGLSFVQLSAGGVHTCGRTAEGAVYCWGSNSEGELGDGTTTDRHVPVRVSGTLRFLDISLGGEHSCGRTSTGAAYCWGLNFSGEVGDGSNEVFVLAPSAVSGGHTFVEVEAGAFHNCGITSLGRTYCWGVGRSGELGDGSYSNSRVPVLVRGGLTFVELSAGYGNSCGRTTGGTPYCWGFNRTSPVPLR